MARKRTKPVAEHIEAAEQSAPAAGASEHTEATPLTPIAAPEPDIFDRMIAARKRNEFETSGPSSPARPSPATRIETAMDAAPVRRASDLPVPGGAETRPRPGAAATRPPVLPKISDKLPNPRSIDDISLEADSRHGARMRLLRFRHHQHGRAADDVWIQFDQSPGKAITDQVKAEGFRWEPRAEAGNNSGAWVKPLESGREIRIMLDAERLFKEIGDCIRRSNGQEPIGQVGVGAG